MANLQFNRGSGAPPAPLLAGEPAYDLTGHVLYVGDGTVNTAVGGSSLAGTGFAWLVADTLTVSFDPVAPSGADGATGTDGAGMSFVAGDGGDSSDVGVVGANGADVLIRCGTGGNNTSGDSGNGGNGGKIILKLGAAGTGPDDPGNGSQLVVQDSTGATLATVQDNGTAAFTFFSASRASLFSPSSGTVPLELTGATGQTARFIECFTGTNKFSVEASGNVSGGLVTAASISTNQNNYAPGNGRFVTLRCGADCDITGWVSMAAGVEMFVANNDPHVLTFKSNSSASSAGNRFSTPYNEDVLLRQGYTLRMYSTGSGWQCTLLPLYEEIPWTPTPTGLTVVGTPTYTGKLTRVGRKVLLTITATATTSTSATAGTTYFDTYLTPVANGTCVAADAVSFLGLGTGFVRTNSRVYVPGWSATGNTIVIHGEFEI